MPEERINLAENYKPDTLILTREEVKGLWEFLQTQYIPYENESAHEACKKIMDFVEEPR